MFIGTYLVTENEKEIERRVEERQRWADHEKQAETGRETDRKRGGREKETETHDRNASKCVKWHVIKVDTAMRMLQSL